MELRRVLLLEQDTTLRDVLGALFEEEQVEVVPCGSYVDLLANALGTPGEVALVDTSSPEQLTDDLRQTLRSVGQLVPLIVLEDQPGLVETGPAALGARAIVAKPFDIEQLLAVLRAACSPDDLALGARSFATNG